MKKIFIKENQLVAEFFSNIGVAWFVAGVISVFLGEVKTIKLVFISVTWGIIFSAFFLLIGIIVINKKL